MENYRRELTERQIKEELFNLYLSNLEESIKAVDFIIPVIQKFDDKAYNARLENAVKKELEERQIDACFDIEYFNDNHIAINMNFYSMKKRCIHFTEVGYWKDEKITKENRCAYLPSSYETVRIARCYDYEKETKTKDSGKWLYYDSNYNRRIVAPVIIQLLKDGQKDLKEKIENLKKELHKVDSYAERLEQIKKDLEILHKEIPYQFRDFFDLKSYVSQWC